MKLERVTTSGDAFSPIFERGPESCSTGWCYDRKISVAIGDIVSLHVYNDISTSETLFYKRVS